MLGLGRWFQRNRRKKWGMGRHSYVAHQQGTDGIIRHTTKQDLNVKRARNRRRNKAARAARKRNR